MSEQMEDPKAKARLTAINGVGLSIERQIEQQQQQLLVRKGTVAGLVAASSVVDKIMQEVQQAVDKESLDGDTAKLVMRWLVRVREEHVQTVRLNQDDVKKQEGVIEGMKKAVDQCELIYKREEQRVAQRANETERGDTDEGGRPLPIREIRDHEATSDA